MSVINLKSVFAFEVPYCDPIEKRTINAHKTFTVEKIEGSNVVCKTRAFNDEKSELVNVPAFIFFTSAIDIVEQTKIDNENKNNKDHGMDQSV